MGARADGSPRARAEEWEVAQDAEVIIYNPQSVGGFHIAEALGVPGIMADALPTWVPTGAFPSFAVPDLRLGEWYNRLTYRLLPLMTGSMFGGVVNQWRSETLRLPPRSRFVGELARSDGRPVPVLYSFSHHVLPPRLDWPEHINMTGYWVLDEAHDWRPTPEQTPECKSARLTWEKKSAARMAPGGPQA